MSGDDYLWDGKGAPDPEVERLEILLGRLRSTRSAPDLSGQSPATPTWSLRWRPLAAAAAVVLAVAAAWTWSRMSRDGWTLQYLEGPSWNAARVVDDGRIGVGEWIDTRDGRVRLAVGKIGEVQLEPDTRVRLVDTGRSSHRLSLTRGVMHALIWAPPRQFIVDTPAAVAVDLGCRYTLEVADDGSGVLRVEAGWVGFEHEGVRALVPADAMAATRPGRGPGTPHFVDASPAFVEALAVVDFGENDEARTRALEGVLAESRVRDALSLWHLLTRASGTDRGRVYDRLASLVPPPTSVTREGILRADQAMLDAWWNELGLESADFWRDWAAPYPTSTWHGD